MTHNDFDFYEDLIRPLMRFLCQINILQTYEDDSDYEKEEPADSPVKPTDKQKKSKMDRIIDRSMMQNSYRSNPESEN
jgi:hypothetical protein